MADPREKGLNSPLLRWSGTTRLLVFLLAATSILCLLVEFYRPGWMRPFTLGVFLPAVVALAVLAAADAIRGTGELSRNVLIGAVSGFVAAVAYDIFRLPFVYAHQLGIAGVVPALPLFKVFPQFGAMILGQPSVQPRYTLGTQLLGWAYHFSNGMTFGIMYVAMLGRPSRRAWGWGIVMAVGLELGMLFTPYPHVFGITLRTPFIIATLLAHLIFGVVMGLLVLNLSRRSARERVAATG